MYPARDAHATFVAYSGRLPLQTRPAALPLPSTTHPAPSSQPEPSTPTDDAVSGAQPGTLCGATGVHAGHQYARVHQREGRVALPELRRVVLVQLRRRRGGRERGLADCGARGEPEEGRGTAGAAERTAAAGTGTSPCTMRCPAARRAAGLRRHAASALQLGAAVSAGFGPAGTRHAPASAPAASCLQHLDANVRPNHPPVLLELSHDIHCGVNGDWGQGRQTQQVGGLGTVPGGAWKISMHAATGQGTRQAAAGSRQQGATLPLVQRCLLTLGCPSPGGARAHWQRTRHLQGGRGGGGEGRGATGLQGGCRHLAHGPALPRRSVRPGATQPIGQAGGGGGDGAHLLPPPSSRRCPPPRQRG